MPLPPTLREYLQEKNETLALTANCLWQKSRPIHERQNRPGSNENGLAHVEIVEINIYRLLQTTTLPNKANSLDDFTPIELFLLSCAACCHDFGKASEIALPSDFQHGEESGDFVYKNSAVLGLDRPQARAIQNVISIHDLGEGNFQENLKSLNKNQAWAAGSYNLQRLAVLLKAADILHCDNSRTPAIGIDAEKLKGEDRKKYLFRYYTVGWKSDGERILIQTDPETEEHIDAIAEGFSIMKGSEWTAVADGMERFHFPFKLELASTPNNRFTQYRTKQLLDEYLEDVIVAYSYIDMQGIYSVSGSGRRLIPFPIEQNYTPLKTTKHPMDLEEPAVRASDERPGPERVPLTDLLSSSRRLLIIGDPGGGKTTFLRLIACVLAKDCKGRDEPGRGLYLGLPLDEPSPMPILIPLSALARTLRDGCAEVNGAGLWRVLLRTMKQVFGEEKAGVFQHLLDRERCVLLLDGLDEEPNQKIRKQIVSVVNSVLHYWGQNLIVLSSRPFGYQAVASLTDMATARIDSFGNEEILEFLTRWASVLFPEDEERSRKAYLPPLISAVFDTPRIRRMASNPVMLTCLCMVHWNERKLPEGKADLLAAVLRWMIDSKEEKRQSRGYENSFAEECFKSLALAMTVRPEGKQATADLAWAAEQLKVPFMDELGIHGSRLCRKGVEFLKAEMIDSGIVEQAETGELKFWHYTFQEYYAGKSLVELSDEDGEGGWWHIVSKHLDDRQWDEVIDHFAGCLALTGRRRLHLLVERILSTATDGDLASQARAVGVLGRILRILEVYKYQPPERLGWDEARNSVMGIFTREGASVVPAEERIAAAEALGQAGDPRINPLDPEMLPIPGMSRVLLGRYPVTVEEYRIFIENKGYENPEYWGDWWTIKGDKGYMEPGDWEEQNENLNRPITGISWYEAVAYCNWLSEQTGMTFRLPGSEEWGKAATNPEGDYPWGDKDPNPDLLNFDGHVGRPTPVGVYPAGAAPGGHLDMAGNVLEWSRDLDEEGGSDRVIRGGSWDFGARYCRSAFRGYGRPGLRGRSFGFRLSRSVALGA